MGLCRNPKWPWSLPGEALGLIHLDGPGGPWFRLTHCGPSLAWGFPSRKVNILNSEHTVKTEQCLCIPRGGVFPPLSAPFSLPPGRGWMHLPLSSWEGSTSGTSAACGVLSASSLSHVGWEPHLWCLPGCWNSASGSPRPANPPGSATASPHELPALVSVLSPFLHPYPLPQDFPCFLVLSAVHLKVCSFSFTQHSE